MNRTVCGNFKDLYTDFNTTNFLDHKKIVNDLFTSADIEEAI